MRWGGEGGHLFPHLHWHTKVLGTVLLSELWGCLTHSSTNRVGSVVRPGQGARPALLSIAAGVGRGSSHSLVNSGSALPPVLGDAGGHLSPHPCHHEEQMRGKTRSLLLTFPGPAHPCLVNRVSSFSCPDEVQACFRNQVLLLVEGRQ